MTYGSTGENKLLVFLPRGEVISFWQCDRVLFYSDLAVGQGTVLLNTVEHNKSNYSKRDYTRSLLAHKIQYKIALPSHRHLVKFVENKVQMLKCPLNWDDVRGAEDIWGGNIGCLKGKTPRKKRHTLEGQFYPYQSPS